MKASPIAKPAALFLLALLQVEQLGATSAVRFFAFGDLPYTEAETEMLKSLLSRVLLEKPPFLVHVGDLKSGNEPCTDRVLRRTAERFRAQQVPVVFTPGDNEWTDCRRVIAGGYDPIERLNSLRHLYFGDPGVLRLQVLGVSQPDAAYPENFWFVHGGVFFATMHVIGSDNNLDPGDAGAMDEFMARSKANRRHLRAAVEAANAADTQAFILIFHADPGFERQIPPPGFHRLRRNLRELLQSCAGPILAIHGDSHRYKFDNPLLEPETGRVLQRFTRLEVPGSPTVAGVWVSVDPQAARPFSAELAYPDSPKHLVE